MQITQEIHCPNCGSLAERYFFTKAHLTQTECSVCDYLMINCSRTGQVVEAYAPGLYAHRLQITKGEYEQSVRSLPNLYEARCTT